MHLSETTLVTSILGEENNENAAKFLEMVKKDQQLIYKVKEFLGNLKSNQDLQHELEELKTIKYQQAHLLAQKDMTKTFITIKSVNNLLKKVQPGSKDEIPFNPLIDCIKAYENATIDYEKILNSIPKDMEQTPEFAKTNDRLKTAMGDLKKIHAGAHKKIRETLIMYGVKYFQSLDLPIKKKTTEIHLNEEQTQKVKTLFERIIEFGKLDKKFIEQLELDVPPVDIISTIYLNERLKSFDYHFLSKTDLNAVDKPEWMSNFIEETLLANLTFLPTLGLEERIIKTLVTSFLNTFFIKLTQRFQQDSPFFLEHEFLFTNFLVCLNEHAYKINTFLEEKGLQVLDPEIYNLGKIYEGKSEFVEKVIAGEMREFEELIYEKIDTMEIVTKEVPDKQKFDIALAETVENFVILYNKNLKKYNATSTDYISTFVRENMLDKAVDSLVSILKKVIEDTEEASLAARFYIMDSISSVSEYANTQLKSLEDFVKAGIDPEYDKEFESVKNFIRATLKAQVEEFWKQRIKVLRGFVNFKPTLNAFSSTESVNPDEILTKEPIPEVKAAFLEYIATIGAKLQEPYASFLLNEFLDGLNQFVLNRILKEYKFTIFGLKFVKAFALHLCEEIKRVSPHLYANQEKKMDEIIKFVKSDKNVQFQLCQKLGSIEEAMLPEEAKTTKKQSAIQNFGYSHLKPKEILALYDTHILM